ncbi:hypothetical protein BH23ACT9_BH23ACT9_02250 [soil metagenome]
MVLHGLPGTGVRETAASFADEVMADGGLLRWLDPGAPGTAEEALQAVEAHPTGGLVVLAGGDRDAPPRLGPIARARGCVLLILVTDPAQLDHSTNLLTGELVEHADQVIVLSDLDEAALRARHPGLTADAADATLRDSGGIPALLADRPGGSSAPMPAQVRVLEQRLDAVGTDGRLLAEVLATLGTATTPDLLALLIHRPVDRVQHVLVRLSAMHLVQRPGGAGAEADRVRVIGMLERHLGASASDGDRLRERALRLGTGPAAPPAGSPVWQRGVIDRPRLTDVLEALSAHQVVTVVATAGFGKTTLVQGWADAHGQAYAALRPEDDGVRGLLVRLAAALTAARPAHPAASAIALLLAEHGPQAADGDGDVSRARRQAALLAAELAADPPAITLVLDDVHVLRDPAAVAFVDALGRQIPPGAGLVLAGRSLPPLRWDRLRAAGAVRDLVADDLAFTAEELRRLDPALPEDDADALVAAGGGWPIAMRLLLQVGRDRAILRDPPQALIRLLGEDALLDEPPVVRQLLRAATVLPIVTPAIATALGLPDAHRTLADLQQRGIFLDHVGAQEVTLKDLTRDLLQQIDPLDPRERADVLRRAADVLVASRAHAHALAALRGLGDDVSLRTFLTTAGPGLVQAGHARDVLAAIGEAGGPMSPPLALLAGQAWLAVGDWDAALPLLRSTASADGRLPLAVAWRVAILLQARGDLDGAIRACEHTMTGGATVVDQARLAATAATMHWLAADLDRAAEQAAAAMALAARAGDDSTSAMAYNAVGMVAAMRGDRPAEARAHRSALRHADAADDVGQQLRTLVNRASHRIDGGSYHDALVDLDRALLLAEATGFAHWAAMAGVNRGSALQHLGQLDAAEESYRRALAGFQDLGSGLECYARHLLAELHVEQGNVPLAISEARQTIRQAEGIGDHQVLGIALALFARLVAIQDPGAAADAISRARSGGTGMRGIAIDLAAGWVALARGDSESARRAGQDAAEAAAARQDQPQHADALVLQALASDPPDPDLLVRAAATWAALDDHIGHAYAELLAARVQGRTGPAEDAADRLRRMGAIGRIVMADQLLQPPAMARIQVRTLGRFDITVDGTAVTASAWQSRKARTVLQVLASRRGQPISRDQLADLVWPGVETAKVRNRLNVALSTIRRLLVGPERSTADAPLRADARSVALDLDGVALDLEDFMVLAARALEASGSDREGLLLRAEAAYTGDFLVEDPYADWAAPIRDEARHTYVAVAHRLAEVHRTAGEPLRAAALIRRVLQHDGSDARAHEVLVDLLGEAGRHTDARLAYEAYVDVMVDLDVDPAPFRYLRSA